MTTLAERYREAYLTKNPKNVGEYMDLLSDIDPDSAMVKRSDNQIWIEFSDGSEWRLGDADKPATDMNHHDA